MQSLTVCSSTRVLVPENIPTNFLVASSFTVSPPEPRSDDKHHTQIASYTMEAKLSTHVNLLVFCLYFTKVLIACQ